MMELQVMLKRFRRTLLFARMLEMAVWGAILGGIVAAVVMILRVWEWQGGLVLSEVSAWMIPVVLLPAGAILGAAVAWLRGASELQAAVLLDRRYDLKERLSTARELLTAGDASGEAKFVYAQAATAGRSLPRRLDVWRCSRRTPAALALVILFCGALLLLPGPDDRLAAKLLAADAIQRDAMIQKLLRAAEKADPETRGVLTELTGVIEARDEKELHRLLEQLRRAGLDVREMLPEEAGDLPPVSSGEGRFTETDTETAFSLPREKERTTGAVTAVGHPRYADHASPPAETTPSRVAPPISAGETPEMLAWRAARARAAQADLDSPVPLRYRAILRAFCRRSDRP
ncbi:MAG: hypothetical protein JW849_09110 [Phycisphaerae bacterium]|nr:hypothetical protein [Phycisphaerae bacterium]